jgi:hypothetical protein
LTHSITQFGPADRTGCISSVKQPLSSNPAFTEIKPPSVQQFAPINRQGCVSSVGQSTSPQAEVEDVFRGHTIDPEVAAIPRVPDDSQRKNVRGFQPEIESIPEPAEPTVLPQEPMTTPEPTVFQPELISDPESAVPKEPTDPRRTEPTGPRCNILTDPNIQSGPQPRVTGSNRRFKTARRSYF